MVQLRTNEQTSLQPSQVLTFLNAGIEQVAAELGPIRLNNAYPTKAGDLFVTLNEDIADIYDMNFSTSVIGNTSPQAIVYPMWQQDPSVFFDNTAGFPGVGAGPPQFWCPVEDANNVIQIQVFPPCMPGFINVYYRARPTLWADTTTNSYTNMDTLAQEAVILWTCARVLEANQRSDEAKDLFIPQFETQITKLKDSIARRSVPKTGQVRDVRALSYPWAPFWF